MNSTRLCVEDEINKQDCEDSHLKFTRYNFKHRQNIKFRANWHHVLIADVVEAVMRGDIQNVVINVSPGSSKTEMIVINFIARALALNPHSRFLHISYSDDLALLNSQTARDMIKSDEYQKFWPLQIANDSKAKNRWNVMVNGKAAGGVYAVSTSGQITGFRAGHMMDEGFWGALIIDDPMKPEDAFSKPKVRAANRRLLTTIKSRKANPKVPIVLIMQRISDNDPTAFIKEGNMPGKWNFISIPAILDQEYIAALDPKYSSLIDQSVKDEKGRVSYWQYKEPLDELIAMETGSATDKEGNRISRHVFASQYQQNPVAIGGNLIRGEWFKRYTVLPKLKYRKIYADTAQKTKESNDYSVFMCVGYGDDGKLYILDIIRGKWEAPELRRRAHEFWQKHKAVKDQDLGMMGQLRAMEVEDKASGTGLIQDLKVSPYNIPVKGIERSVDKLTRVMDAIPYIEAGDIHVPWDAPWMSDFINECEAFMPDDTHAFDDQVDPLCDAIKDNLGGGNKLKTWARLGELNQR